MQKQALARQRAEAAAARERQLHLREALSQGIVQLHALARARRGEGISLRGQEGEVTGVCEDAVTLVRGHHHFVEWLQVWRGRHRWFQYALRRVRPQDRSANKAPLFVLFLYGFVDDETFEPPAKDTICRIPYSLALPDALPGGARLLLGFTSQCRARV